MKNDWKHVAHSHSHGNLIASYTLPRKQPKTYHPTLLPKSDKISRGRPADKKSALRIDERHFTSTHIDTSHRHFAPTCIDTCRTSHRHLPHPTPTYIVNSHRHFASTLHIYTLHRHFTSTLHIYTLHRHLPCFTPPLRCDYHLHRRRRRPPLRMSQKSTSPLCRLSLSRPPPSTHPPASRGTVSPSFSSQRPGNGTASQSVPLPRHVPPLHCRPGHPNPGR